MIAKCRARCACLTKTWPITVTHRAIERQAQRALRIMDLTQFPERPAYDIGERAMATERGPRGEDFARQILGTVERDLSKPVAELDVLDVGSGYGHTALALAR